MKTTAWEFSTARVRVALEVEPEELDPADSFQFQEDVDMVRNGDVEWFAALLVVYVDGKRIAWDSLGGCAYRTIEEFYTSHRDIDPLNRNCSLMRAARGENVVIGHYFPDMVHIAIAEARKELRNLQSFRLRT